MSQLVIRPLDSASLAPAVRLLAASMRDNPLHQRVFAAHDRQVESLLAAVFNRLLQRQLRTGLVLGAYEGEALVGVAAMVAPGHCRLGPHDKFAMLTMLVRARALQRLPYILRWLWAWMRRDPDFAHWHLGPAAVDRSRQGQGIGSALMAAVCEQLDQRRGIGYLETDKAENVRLYSRGGFRVIAQQPVLQVTNWFMLRHPRDMA